MNKYFGSLVVCLFANFAFASDLPIGVKPTDLPVYSPNGKLSLWVANNDGMEGSSETAYLYSDGTYCYSLGAMGAVVLLKGKWQFNQNNTAIDVKINTDTDNQFFLDVYKASFYDDEQGKMVVHPNTLRLSDLFFYGQPVYLGFGNQAMPNEMVLFDYDKHQENILVPNNSRYLFVGSKVINGQVSQIARFDLHTLPYNHYYIELASNRSMGVSADELRLLELDYVIQNGKLGIKRKDASNIKFFSDTASIDLDSFQNDDMNLKRLYGYCSGKVDELYFDVLQNKQSNLTKPTYIQWRGTISPTANWLKPKD